MYKHVMLSMFHILSAFYFLCNKFYKNNFWKNLYFKKCF
ncbi:hypothetical protein KN10_1557 [Anoxybacillus flavithermus NBRC 109594]|uniref:Uncharacterized protein n=1 Tax=Anoxybacillus flavithermus NBRC 109594 TaxID=1315967 RepID=R4FC96_9BACL|nr:hypothetical protein KN10_1557 [Anoxybacillus flavithermus NBRC 109594]